MVSSLVPNAHISEVILTPASDMEASSDDPRKELDSHTNMVVLRSKSFVFEQNGRICNVIQPFRSNLFVAKEVPIIDRALAYDCTYTGEVYALVIRNALHVPSMEHNMIPTFITRAGRVIVNDVPKIPCEYPVADNHCVSFDHSDLRIPSQLNGVFSCFHTRVTTEIGINECEMVFVTPDTSDLKPHSQSYERN